MKVSVIIPNYCHAAYLTERIESVLAQSFTDFEVIILDDCSADNSKDVIERYRSHPKVSHIIYNEQNSGSPFRQWLKGVELAQGEYIWIAESDDVADPKFLEYCVAALDCNKNCALAFTNCHQIDAQGKIICSRPQIVRRGAVCKVYDGREFIKYHLAVRNTISNASMVVFRKSALPDNHSFVSYRNCGDWLFWIGVAMKGHVAHINLPLDMFRQHGCNTTAKGFASGNSYIETVRLVEELFCMMQFSAARRFAIVGKHTINMNRVLKKRIWNESTTEQLKDMWSKISKHQTLAMYWYKSKICNLLGL